MAEAEGIARRGWPRWLLRVTSRLFLGVLVVLLAILWAQTHVATWVYWQAGLWFLIALEIAYVTAVVLCTVGAAVCGGVLCGGRGRFADRRPMAARGLLFGVSLLSAAGAAELTTTAWRHRSRRWSAVAAGGLETRERSGPFGRFAAPLDHIELPVKPPAPRGNGDLEVVVLGESSALGVPFEDHISVGRIICWKLENALPGRAVHLTELARAGDTLERQHQALASLDRRPNVLIVYCGHNEFFSRLWWSRNLTYYFAEELPNGFTGLAAWIERSSSFCGLIAETAAQCRVAIPPSLHNSRELIDVPVYTAAEYAALLADFRGRLDEIVAYARRVGALVVLIVPPANDAGFEPSRSFLLARTSRPEREQFRRDFLAALKLEASDPAASIERYRGLLERQPCFAEAHFRLALLLEERNAWEDAYQHFVAARDFDGMPIRCPSDFQQAYRDVAARHDCVLIDGQAYFHQIGRHGLLDDQLFQDAMHPSLRGQIALAQGVLAALHTRGGTLWPPGAPVPVVDPAMCVERFAVGPGVWRAVCSREEWFGSLLAPLRYDPSRRLRARDAVTTAIAKIDAGAAPESVGLPNVGVPSLVPMISTAQIRRSAESSPRFSVQSFLEPAPPRRGEE
jgi:hypothetical protein